MHKILQKLLDSLSGAISSLSPKSSTETPGWIYHTGRGILSVYLILTPILYDIAVPEVAGDIRWYFSHLTALILAILGLFYLFNRKTKVELKPLFPFIIWCMFGLVITATISWMDSINPYRSWWFYKHFISYIGVFFGFYLLRHKDWYQTIIWLLVLPLIFVGGLGICQFLNITDNQIAANLGNWWHYTGDFINWARTAFPQSAPPAGTFANKNLAASWVVLIWPLTLYLFITSRVIWSRFLSASLLTIGTVFLIFGRSRASWISFVGAILFLSIWVLLNRKTLWPIIKQNLHWQHAFFSVIAISIVVMAYPIVSPLKKNAISSSVAQQISNLQKLRDFGPRLAYNLNGLKMVADNPISGVGIGSFHTAYPPYHKAFYQTPWQGYRVEARPQRTHNDLMQAFIEQGVLSGLLHLSIVFFSIIAAWRLTRAKIVEKAGIMPTFLITGIMGFTLNAMGDFPMQMPTAPILLFACFGLMAGMAQMYKVMPSVGWQKYFVIPKVTILSLLLLIMGLTIFVVKDDYNRRQGAIYLKSAMARTMSGVLDDTTLDLIKKSFDTYSWNARMREFRGIIYSQYKGTKPLSNARKKEVLLESLEHDPYAANHLINLSALLHRAAEQQIRLDDNKSANKTLQEIDSLIPRLKVVAPVSHHTWNIIGLLHHRRGQNKQAIQAFVQALKFKTDDPVAINSLRSLGIKVIIEP